MANQASSSKYILEDLKMTTKVMAAKNWGSGDATTQRFEGEAAEKFLQDPDRKAGYDTIYVEKGQGWAPSAGWRDLDSIWSQGRISR